MTSQFRNDFLILSLANLVFHYFRQTAIAPIVEIKGHYSKDTFVEEWKHLEGRNTQIPLVRN